jgi:hypothetical protein
MRVILIEDIGVNVRDFVGEARETRAGDPIRNFVGVEPFLGVLGLAFRRGDISMDGFPSLEPS